MARAQVIEPIKQVLKTDDGEQHNVCAYCRVSTDESDQKNSLKSQEAFFEIEFDNHPEWNNVGIFADRGISGTSLEKRDEFNKMIALAKKRKIDFILTKEVSRFSRNVRDLLNVVEELRDKGVYILFMSDNINTQSNDYREALIEAATSAEKESLKTSRRVRWGQQQQMQRGIVFGRKEMYGYNIKRNEKGIQFFEIVEDEAEVVKKIFEWFAEGDGTHIIARRLEAEGIKTKRFKNGWTNTVILRILRNEKYVGDLAQGKTYTPDPLTHKKKYNKGQSHQYYIENHHLESAIISRDLWNRVQAILKENEPADEIKTKHSNRYWTSGKVFCGCCGGRYVSYLKKQKSSTYKAWVCFENHQRGQQKEVTNYLGETYTVGCNNKRVNDKVLKIAIKDIINQLILPYKDQIRDELSGAIKGANAKTDTAKQINSLNKKINALKKDIKVLTEKLISGVVSDETYKMFCDEKENKILEYQAKIQLLRGADDTELTKYALINKRDQINKIIALSDNEINEEWFGRITKKIVVYPKNVLEIHLSFMFTPIYLRYKTEGRGDSYNAIFDVLTKSEIELLLKKEAV